MENAIWKILIWKKNTINKNIITCMHLRLHENEKAEQIHVCALFNVFGLV